MKIESQKNKILYAAITGISFLAILICNGLTTYMSDDFIQLTEEVKLHSIVDLFAYGYEHYMTVNGRSNTHMVVRLVLQQNVWIFNVVNSFCFIGLINLIYYNVRGRKAFDNKVYLWVNILVWLFSVEFGQTILWKTGAINYLWATTLIMGFFTCFRKVEEMWGQIRHPVLVNILLFLFSILAGWCNENTSGGLLLYILICMGIAWYRKRKVYSYQIASGVGVCLGLFAMVMAPGNSVRLDVVEETHTGLLAILSRFLQMVEAVEGQFYMLLMMILVCMVIVIVQKGRTKEAEEVFIFVFLATAIIGAIILAPTPSNRVYFGAGVFLILACSQGFQLLSQCDRWSRIVQYSVLGIMVVQFGFTYIDASSQLLRISLQHKEIEASIEQQKAIGVDVIVIEPYDEFYRTEYSYAHDSEITEDATHWSNWIMGQYYGVKRIVIDEEIEE